MKKLLATTALVALVTGPVMAQDEKPADMDHMDAQTTTDAEMSADVQTDPADAAADMDAMQDQPTYMANDVEIRASDFLGMNIYTREGGMTAEDTNALADRDDITDPADDWEDLAEIDDVLISPEGKVDTVIANVGGFLDMGDRDVRISIDDLAFVRDADDEGEFFVVYKGDPTILGEGEAHDAEAAMSEGYRSMRDETSLDETHSDEAGLMETNTDDYTAEDLEGASVYGPNDDRIGEVGKLVLSDDGEITHAVIDVGGFLGIGEKHVSLKFEDLRMMRTESDETPRVYVDMTEEELENQPEYEE
ncbi:PRC-barrel domain-containing protein [Pontibaca salina]|uniref:PRC-barrel domain-containing protein n=1 Tax=Pontibaca salina TaxID=2795731 RepID=A0A934HJP4_9RHOB|nr:PRC-barrel domain-containing protein [Pontibaca salina]MBI6629419.1 PRC-barrel domain-containing protein [Pontibaca salina]